MRQSGSLLVDLKVGQSLSIDGGRIVVTLKKKSGQLAKLHFAVDDGICIDSHGSDVPRRKSVTGAQHARMGVVLRA